MLSGLRRSAAFSTSLADLDGAVCAHTIVLFAIDVGQPCSHRSIGDDYTRHPLHVFQLDDPGRLARSSRPATRSATSGSDLGVRRVSDPIDRIAAEDRVKRLMFRAVLSTSPRIVQRQTQEDVARRKWQIRVADEPFSMLRQW